MKRFIIFIVQFLCTVSLFAQFKVDGKVIDENKLPLPGATIVVKGTTHGTTTDLDGRFTLKNIQGNAVLMVSYLGYESVEVKVNNKNKVFVQLKDASVALEEVIAIGYGNAKRKDFTGAVGSVSSADIVKGMVSNYDQALAGRIAGVQVSSTDGTPGEGLNIVIRGGNSITGDNSPLYVVDGVAIENFDPATLSAADIKDIDVLKDASSTAIYGSRGANGVILITTQSGRTDGKTDITVKASYGASWIPTRLEVMSPYDYVRYQLESAYALDGYNPGEKVGQFLRTWGDPELYRNVKGTKWQDEIMRLAPFKSINAILNGGNEKTTVYYSAEALDQDGTLINTSFQKFTNNLKITHKINPKSKLTAQLLYTYNNRQGINVSGNNYTSIIRDAIQYRPVEPINSDGLGLGGYDPSDDTYKYLFDPVLALSNTDRQNKSHNLRGLVMLNQRFSKAWELVVSANFQNTYTQSSVFYKQDTQQATRGENGISATLSKNNQLNISGSAVLNYKYSKKGHNVMAMVGTEASYRGVDNSSFGSNRFPTDIFGIDKLQLGTVAAMPSSYRGENTLASFFGRVNYTLQNKYLFTFNMRADGSSKFSKENRWGYFPSASVAWRMNEESFLNDVSWLTNLKLRGGWGLTGNNRIGDYDYMTYLNLTNSTGYVSGEGESYTPGVTIANLGVPDLRWETTSQTSIGVDLGFLKNRLSATLDWYYKRTYDLLLNADMALSTGFAKVQQNVGEVSNKGWEFTLNSVNIQRKNFTWRSSFNISMNRNKVLKLNGNQQAIYTNAGFNSRINEYSYISQVGKPVGLMYGLVYDGLYTWDDFNYNNQTQTFSLKDGIPDNGSLNLAPGNIKYVDQNHDGTINELDRVIIGDPTPKHFGGFTNDFTLYKNIDLQIFFQWSYGGKILNANYTDVGVAEPSRLNTLGYLKNYWSPYNTDTEVNAMRYESYFGKPTSGNKIDTRAVEDGSYLKLKSITLGYTLPKKWVKKAKLKNVRFYVSAQNLYTWTNYSGYDPDVSVSKYGAMASRLDYSAYPQSSTVMGGIDIIF